MTPLVFPLPPDALRANSRAGAHWGPKNKAKTEYMTECAKIIRSVAWSDENGRYPVHLYVKVYLGKNQRCDAPDVGFWCKVICDSLVTEGVFPDDGSKYIRPFTADVGRDWEHPRVEVWWAHEELSS